MAGRDDRWDAHPWLAWWVRVAVVLVPLGASVGAALLLVVLLPRPRTLAPELLWWTAVLGGAVLAAHLVDRLARRALPLAALLTLTLVFPDRAPSRLRSARATSLREVERQVAALELVGEPAEAAAALVRLVGALGRHDKRTRGHSERVRAYVDLLTEELRLPEADRVRLRWAALLHDIGKLSVPGSVLNGGSDLQEEEWAALRAHPDEGQRLAAAMMPWLGEWGRCVREHHERWDGHGYPRGLAGTQISHGARIVAVADAYEVMTANRSYRRAVSPAAARAELLRCAGSDFDPAVVRSFLQVGIGRLRWVVGPLGLLPPLPFAAFGDRAGQLVRAFTSTAAAGAVALGVAAAPSPPAPTPAGPGRSPVVAAPAPAPVVQPPAPPAPSRSADPRPVTVPVRRPVAAAVPPEEARPSARPAVTLPPVARQPGPGPTPSPLLSVDVSVPGVVAVSAAVRLGPGGPPVQLGIRLVPRRYAGGHAPPPRPAWSP
jgi:hypothetical protein